jgi:uncharacterized cupredoxin-like copper-binding protein
MTPLKLATCIATVLLVPVAVAAKQNATLDIQEWNKPDGSRGFTLSRDQVQAGRITFRIKNISTDEVHEVLVVKTDLAPDAFPLEPGGTRVDEKKLKVLKDLGDLKPGHAHTVTVDLKPGRYVLLCNQPGHFKAGMFTSLTVTS